MEDLPPDQQTVRRAWTDLSGLQNQGTDQADVQPSAFLQLRRLSYARLFLASVLGCVFNFLGLIILGLGESRRLAFSPPAVLSFRVVAWLLLYQLPVQSLALLNLRALAQYGLEPDFGLLHSSSQLGEWTSVYTLKARLFLVVMHGSSLLVFVVLTCAPFHPEHHFLGYVLIYGVGHVAIIAVCEKLLPMVAPFRHAKYGWISGPPTLGVAIMGFFLVVTGLAIGKRYLGSWFGGSVAVVLVLYENVGALVVCNFYTEKFVKDASVKEAYSGSEQALTPSIAIALITCMAEGARLTVLVAAAMFDPEDDAYKVALGATLVLCLLSRAGCLDACVHAWTGSRRISNGRLLLRECRFQSGYPRILLLCTLGIVRLALGARPSPNSTVTSVVLLTSLETVLEDVLIGLMKRAGLTYEPQLGLRSAPQPTAVVPEPTAAVSQGEDSRTDDVWLFQYGLADFPVLPFWAQFAPVVISQFHTVLFIFIFCGGVSTALGLCDYGYTGIGRGIVWWPIDEAGHMCD